MRLFYLLVLLLMLAALGVFAVQNQELVTLRYLDPSVVCPLSLLICGVYLVGMVSGWTVLGVFRRSLRKVSEQPRA